MRLSFGIKRITFYHAFAVCLLFFSQSGHSAVIPIDLNDFFPSPSAAISIAVDGTSALLTESASAATVSLINDPDAGDPEVIIAGVGTSLIFDYTFTELVDDDNYFTAFVFDGNSGLSFGAGFEFLTSISGSGSLSFDLSSLVGELLGLQFELGPNSIDDAALTSTLSISNGRLETTVAQVSEPMMLLLFSLGLIIMVLAASKRDHLQQAI